MELKEEYVLSVPSRIAKKLTFSSQQEVVRLDSGG